MSSYNSQIVCPADSLILIGPHWRATRQTSRPKPRTFTHWLQSKCEYIFKGNSSIKTHPHTKRGKCACTCVATNWLLAKLLQSLTFIISLFATWFLAWANKVLTAKVRFWSDSNRLLKKKTLLQFHSDHDYQHVSYSINLITQISRTIQCSSAEKAKSRSQGK